MQAIAKSFDLEEFVSKLWAAKWRMLFFFLVVWAVAVLIILYWPRTYASEARIYLQLGRESVALDPTISTGQMVNVQTNDREDEIQSAIDVLKSRGFLSQVVDRLTPAVVLGQVSNGEKRASPVVDTVLAPVRIAVQALRSIDPTSDRERAIIEVKESFDVNAERKSEIITLTYEADTPLQAQQVLRTAIDVYREEHARLHLIEGSLDFFDQQRTLLDGELAQAADALRAAKNRIGLASIEGHKTNLEGQYRDTVRQIAESQRGLAEVEARIGKLNETLSDLPERIASSKTEVPNSAADLQGQQLYTLKLKQLEYEAKYSDDHPRLISIRKQVEEAERQQQQLSENRSQSTDDINPIHRDLTLDRLQAEASRAGLQQTLTTLESQRERILAEIRQVNADEIEITELEREMKIKESKLIAYTDSLEQARIDRALANDRISSVKELPPTLQEKPVAPSKLLVVLFASMMSIGGAAAVGYVTVRLDDRLITPNAIRDRLGVPVLTTLPKSKNLVKARAL